MYETNEQMSKRIDREIWDRVARMSPDEIKMHGRMALGTPPRNNLGTIEILLAILILLLIFH